MLGLIGFSLDRRFSISARQTGLTLQSQQSSPNKSRFTTKSVVITVNNAVSEKDAVEVGRACARNNLLKAAIFGGDPNWGRVLAAVGTADADMDPLAIDVKLNGVQVCTNSAPDADKSTVNFDARLVEIEIDLKIGSATATIMTNDLTHDYVHENSAYST